MQINPKWQSERMDRLGATDLHDEETNILVGVDYLAELFTESEDIYLVLMLYNMKRSTAINKYDDGEYTYYAEHVSEVSMEFERMKGK